MSGLLQGRAFYTPLPAHLKLTLLALADEANDEGEGIFIGQARLARKCGSTDRTVRQNLGLLRDLGYIRRLPERHPKYGTDQYELELDLLPTTREIRPEDSSALEGERQTDRKPSVVPTGSPLPPTHEIPARSTREIQASFDAFYSTFPRHEGKGAARKAYAGALKKASAFALLTGAKRYRDDPGRVAEFTCLPATWLNQERWSDDPLPHRNGHVRDRAAEIMQGAISKGGEPPAALPG